MIVYADTNFVTRLYLDRPGSQEAARIYREHRPILPVTWLLQIELINALEQSVFSGFGAGKDRITLELAGACQQLFRDDLRQGRWLRFAELSTATLTLRFEDIALRHTARRGFRTYDILHVASAQLLGCTAFWSFDRRAKQLAELEGLAVFS